MSELNFFAAKTQARLTYLVVVGFLAFMLLLMVLACLPVTLNPKLLDLLDRAAEAFLLIVSTSTGFWLSRHRSSNGSDAGVQEDPDTDPPKVVPTVPLSTTSPEKTP
jgi:hypothetical protein